jgi:hypothetical protein
MTIAVPTTIIAKPTDRCGHFRATLADGSILVRAAATPFLSGLPRIVKNENSDRTDVLRMAPLSMGAMP